MANSVVGVKNISLCTGAEEVSSFIDILSKLSVDSSNDYEISVELESDLLKEIQINKIIVEIKSFNPNDESNHWKILCLLFHVFSSLDNAFAQNDELERLSVQQIKHLKNAIRLLIEAGLLKNLQPNLLKKKSPVTTTDHLSGYKQLLGTLYGISASFKSPLLKSLLITNYLKPILLSFYQIMYCPLKKPDLTSETNDFVVTREIYNNLIKDRENFKGIFKSFVSSIHPLVYIRETMLLLDKSSPNWLKKSLSNTLGIIICSPSGVKNVILAMFDSVGIDELDDNTKSWKILMAITNVIIDTFKFPDFKENTYKQLCELLKLRSKSGEMYKPFERIFALCTRLLYHQDKTLCEELFIRRTLEPLLSFTNKSKCECETNDSVQQSIRICYYIVAETNFDAPLIPVNVILPTLNVVFRLFLVSSSESNLHNVTKNILLKALLGIELNKIFSFFDTFLFGYPHEQIFEVNRNLEFCMENNQIIIKKQTYTVVISPLSHSEAILELVNDNVFTKTAFFQYLLNFLSVIDFSKGRNNTNLLELESMPTLHEMSECKIVVYKVLSELASDKDIQAEISANPIFIIEYINTIIESCVQTKVHQTNEYDSDSFQQLFLILMLLQIFVESATSETKCHYVGFIKTLNLISNDCTNTELKQLCNQVVIKLERRTDLPKNSPTSELDCVLQDICDSLLPVRGHALMTLSKLIQKRDKGAMERKQYIMNIFMQNIKNKDSFIYLSAIGGLAAMGDVFPLTVLKTVADEYVEFSRKDSEDGHEVRIKLGEVLVRITKLLGEMAVKYKTLLLNTFLEVTKDEDHLMRASSLSNLGEVCKVLGYKLGTIVNEVLVCVHSIITTDKAPEPRRAAVTVLRQLFVGLEKEMIVFLKDDILPIYRTLKHIYYHDEDDIMRLQAQLALEQLNENMKDFVFPNPQLHTEKKIVMLD